jgi:hypothetical protein
VDSIKSRIFLETPLWPFQQCEFIYFMTSFEQHCYVSYRLYLILKKFYMCNICIWFQIVQSNYFVFALTYSFITII